MNKPIDLALEKFATPSQWEKLKALHEHGSERAAGKALGMHNSSIRSARMAVLAKATRQGYSPDHDMIHPLPDGYKLKGTSTLYDMQTGEAKIQWVKSDADKERQDEIFREVVEAMASAIPRAKPVPGPKHVSEEHLAALPVGDHHMGMLSWAEETGTNYDLSIGENHLNGAVDYLVAATPPCARSVLAVLGDFLHYDGFESVTPKNRNQLDSDSRFPKIVRAAIRSLRYSIAAMLKRHGEVLVIIEIGNHDPASAIFLMQLLAALYEDEPRVAVDTSPARFHYFEFGKNLVGITHGDGAKMQDLPLIMAHDRPTEWGRTKFRYIWTGHVHHDSAKDIGGVRVESFRILPPVDAWAAAQGYRSQSDMKAVVLHKEHGEVARHTVNPGMLQ